MAVRTGTSRSKDGRRNRAAHLNAVTWNQPGDITRQHQAEGSEDAYRAWAASRSSANGEIRNPAITE